MSQQQTPSLLEQQAARKQHGDAAFTAKRFSEAVELYKQAVAIAPDAEACAALHGNICASLLSIGDPADVPEALQHAERAIELRPRWHKAYYRRATAVIEQHRFQDCLDDCQRVLELEPTATDVVEKCVSQARDALQGCAALPPAIDAAIADPAQLLASTWCIIGGGEDPARLHQLLKLDQDGELERLRAGLLAHLAQLKERVASLPIEVLHAATRDAARTVDGICALALYTSDFPRGEVKLARLFDTALRVAAGSGASDLFSRRNAEFVRDATQPFRAALEWMLRRALQGTRRVDFRSVGFALDQPCIGSRFPQHCFNSMVQPDAVEHLTRDTVMVLLTKSSRAVGFASMAAGRGEVLLPPGVELEVAAIASATLMNVLHFGAGKKLVTLCQAGMRPTPDELFKAARAVLPVYERFRRIYQIPSVAPRGSQQAAVAVGGEAGGGAASGNNSNDNQHAMRLNAALDQNSSNKSRGSDMLIIAGGGTGKTAAAVFAQVHLSRQDASRRLLPIFLPLGRLNRQTITREGGLDAALAGVLGCDVETLLEAVRRFNVVAILDSLDETMVKDEHWAGLFERNPAAQQCRVIMTSRPTPLATQQHRRIFGRARRLHVLDLLPLPPLGVNSIFALLVNDESAQLPAALLASGDATLLLASFAATLVDKRVDISGVAGQRELLDLYLQHTCDLPQEALSKLCFKLLAGGFHCGLGVARAAVGRVADLASHVPCRVEDEFDHAADFSLLHRSLVEHVIAREVAAGRLSFGEGSELRKLSPVLLTGITRMLLADAQCSFEVRLEFVKRSLTVDGDPSALELAQEMLAEEERRAAGQPADELATLQGVIRCAFKDRGDLVRALEFAEREVSMLEALYEQEHNAARRSARGRNLAALCDSLAIMYKEQTNYTAARRHFERAIELIVRLGEDAMQNAAIREKLAHVLLDQGDPAGALREYDRCLAIYERRLNIDDDRIDNCLANIRAALKQLPRPVRAQSLVQRALDIQSQTLRLPLHLAAVRTERLGAMYRLLGNKWNAQRYYREAATLYWKEWHHQAAERCRRSAEEIAQGKKK